MLNDAGRGEKADRKTNVFYVPASYFSVIRDTLISDFENLILCSIFPILGFWLKVAAETSVRLFEVSLISKISGYLEKSWFCMA